MNATRFVVYGPSGSGKTTLARRLAQTRGLRHIELDEFMHVRPDWDDATPEEFRARISEFLEANPDGWVIDGNYSVARDLILPRAQVAVRLHLPFRVVYPRLVLRTLRRMASHELLWGTNYETWSLILTNDSMLSWGIINWRQHHRKMDEAMANAPSHVRIIELRSPGHVQAFLRMAARTSGGISEPFDHRQRGPAGV